jgi:DNA helicase-2/ATP-dependent DNA helicase PcrA
VRISDNQTIILGAPGCGKTTALLSILDKCFQEGIQPHEVAFVSFTKKATEEAISRACEKFNFKPAELPNFRTLHSLAFQQLALTPEQILNDDDFAILSKMLGVKFTKNHHEQIGEGYTDAGDVMRALESISRSRIESIDETYRQLAGYSVEWRVFERYVASYNKYKEDNLKIDFTDMLTRFLMTGNPINVKVVFIDEAQDLSKLQWEVCKLAFATAERVFIAGDDDQAIYKWAGANVDGFLALEGTRVVLNKSHRLPKRIHALAQRISRGIKKRIEKQFEARNDMGHVERFADIEYVPFNDDSWLMLARNAYSLGGIEKLLKAKGYAYLTPRGSSVSEKHVHAIQLWEALRAGAVMTVKDFKPCLEYLSDKKFAKGTRRRFERLAEGEPITLAKLKSEHGLLTDEIWHDALDGIKLATREYYLSILRRGQKLTDTPNITVSTIHASKGAEANNVLLLTNISQRTHEELTKNPDDEHRVFYVAVTRARQNLYIVAPHSYHNYEIPVT